MFQSTRPRGARLAAIFCYRLNVAVSIHAPARGATCFCGFSIPGLSFNPRAREGRDSTFILRFFAMHGFNPRAREGRDRVLQFRWRAMPVSIHAPARGATPRSFASSAFIFVSIHAPARGATQAQSLLARNPQSFNPRAREGRDIADMLELTPSNGFNPRAREGRDNMTSPTPTGGRPFQSTRPRGARQGQHHSQSNCPGFQSTRPRGARLLGTDDLLAAVRVSIHAPARGAT